MKMRWRMKESNQTLIRTFCQGSASPGALSLDRKKKAQKLSVKEIIGNGVKIRKNLKHLIQIYSEIVCSWMLHVDNRHYIYHFYYTD